MFKFWIICGTGISNSYLKFEKDNVNNKNICSVSEGGRGSPMEQGDPMCLMGVPYSFLENWNSKIIDGLS